MEWGGTWGGTRGTSNFAYTRTWPVLFSSTRIDLIFSRTRTSTQLRVRILVRASNH